MRQIEFFIAINEDGDMTGDMDADEARTRLTDDYGGEQIQVRKMVFSVPHIKTIEVTLPETEATVALAAAE